MVPPCEESTGDIQPEFPAGPAFSDGTMGYCPPSIQVPTPRYGTGRLSLYALLPSAVWARKFSITGEYFIWHECFSSHFYVTNIAASATRRAPHPDPLWLLGGPAGHTYGLTQSVACWQGTRAENKQTHATDLLAGPVFLFFFFFFFFFFFSHLQQIM